VLARRVQLLVAATITYNVIEALVAIMAGTLASSTALVGFGLDSVIEVSSAAAVAWQFSSTDHERRERTALRIIAFSLFAWLRTSRSSRSGRWPAATGPSTPPWAWCWRLCLSR
jgi:hypothetical protein